MAAEVELERMIVRMLGDNTDYARMLNDSAKLADQAAKKIEPAAKRLEKIGGRIAGIGKRISLAITAPLAGVGALSTREFAGFEASLSNIEGLVGLSKDTVESFGKEILDLAPKVGKGPQELSEALFFITSAGLRGEQALEALRVTSKAAAAGMGETKSVADAVTSAMNAYGLENLSATKATEVLTAAVREGKAEASTFAPVLGQVLPTANELGVSFDQAAGTIAFLTKSTGSASIAATGLRGVMAQLVRTTTQGEKALAKVGLTSDQLKASVGARGLLPTLRDLRSRFDAAGIPISEMFSDMEGLNAVLQLTGPNAESAAKVIENVGNSAGIVDEAFKAVSETLKFQGDQAFATLKVALIEVGKILLPFTSQFVSGLQALVEWFRGLNEPTKRFIVIAGAIVAVVGPLLVGFGTLVAFIGMAIPAIASFGSFMLGLGPIVLGVISVVAGLVGFFATMGVSIEDVKEIFSAFMGFVEAGWILIRDTAIASWNAILNFVTPIFKKIRNAMKGPIQQVKEFLVNTFMLAEFVVSNFGNTAKLVGTKVALTFVTAFNQIRHFFTGVMPSLFIWFLTNWENIFFTAFDIATTVFINLGKNIRQLFSNLMKIISGELAIGDLLEGINFDLTKGFANSITKLPQIPERQIGGLEAALQDQLSSLQNKFTADFATFVADKNLDLGKELTDLVREAEAQTEGKRKGDERGFPVATGSVETGFKFSPDLEEEQKKFLQAQAITKQDKSVEEKSEEHLSNIAADMSKLLDKAKKTEKNTRENTTQTFPIPS